jgi:tRNA pseudouridine13 synthase
MKVKQQPEDFQVEELTSIVPVPQGPFAFYRLEKRGWSTPDALAAIRRRWQIENRRISYGGLKDRHAWTAQYLTILHGPRRGLHHQNVTVDYLGQLHQPYTSRDIRANRFHLTLRALDSLESRQAWAALNDIQEEGVPNYFDDQRFGSVSAGGEFVARLLVRGQFAEALFLALTASYEFDRGSAKQEKHLLQTHWGNWTTLKTCLPRGHARSLMDYLRQHPGDFRGAVARLRPELRGLYLSAYQSYLWNRMLARWIREHTRPEQLLPVSFKLGQWPMWQKLDEGQRRVLADLCLPLPSARLKLAPHEPLGALVHSILAEEGLELKQLQVKGLRGLFFAKGERRALCRPAHLESALAADERHHGLQKLQLAFELPRGSYATLLVKRLQGASEWREEQNPFK